MVKVAMVIPISALLALRQCLADEISVDLGAGGLVREGWRMEQTCILPLGSRCSDVNGPSSSQARLLASQGTLRPLRCSRGNASLYW